MYHLLPLLDRFCRLVLDISDAKSLDCLTPYSSNGPSNVYISVIAVFACSIFFFETRAQVTALCTGKALGASHPGSVIRRRSSSEKLKLRSRTKQKELDNTIAPFNERRFYSAGLKSSYCRRRLCELVSLMGSKIFDFIGLAVAYVSPACFLCIAQYAKQALLFIAYNSPRMYF